MNFEVTVVEFPAKTLVGTKVRTTMQKAQSDCPALWQSFGPRICELFPECKGVYGVSVMLNETDFDYWAAVETASDATLLPEMETVKLPSGLYARCAVANVEQLGAAYMFLYGPWIQGQTEYALNMEAPCFELYPSDWQENDAFEVYAPVKK